MGRIRRRLSRLGRKNKGWRTASGHRKKSTANERRNNLSSNKGRQDQEFRVVKGTDPTYPYEVQWRNK